MFSTLVVVRALRKDLVTIVESVFTEITPVFSDIPHMGVQEMQCPLVIPSTFLVLDPSCVGSSGTSFFLSCVFVFSVVSLVNKFYFRTLTFDLI